MTNSPGFLTQEVAAILRAARARHNVTQGTLAAAVGVSQSQLSKMLRGQRDITLDQLDAMCWMLQLTVYEVIEEADQETDARDPLNPSGNASADPTSADEPRLRAVAQEGEIEDPGEHDA